MVISQTSSKDIVLTTHCFQYQIHFFPPIINVSHRKIRFENEKVITIPYNFANFKLFFMSKAFFIEQIWGDGKRKFAVTKKGFL